MRDQKKPCPFCKAPPKIVCNKLVRMYFVSCRNSRCEVQPHISVFAATKEEAIRIWNRKVAEVTNWRRTNGGEGSGEW